MQHFGVINGRGVRLDWLLFVGACAYAVNFERKPLIIGYLDRIRSCSATVLTKTEDQVDWSGLAY